MQVIPEIVFLKLQFQPLIADFFNDDDETENTVTFCQKITQDDIPAFGKSGGKVRDFER